jgi:hypothetical protein
MKYDASKIETKMNTKTIPNKRQILPPHKHPADAETYLAACSAEERRLVDLAIQMLGSSYFMEKSHGYVAWKAKQGNPKGQ